MAGGTISGAGWFAGFYRGLIMIDVKPNRKFKKRYNRLFQKNPLGANMFLLIAELADKRGRVQITEEEIAALFNARFEDPKAYQLPVGADK